MSRGAVPLALVALALGTASPLARADRPIPPKALPLVNTWTLSPVDAADRIAPAATLDYVFVALATGKIEAHRMAGTGELAWTRPLVAAMSLVAGDGLVYVCTADGVTALAEATGDTRWHAEINPTGAAPAWRAGWLFVSTPNGTIVAYRTADGTQAWKQELGAPLSSPPVTTATEIVASLSDRRLVAVRIADGHLMWRTTLGQMSTTLSWPVFSVHFGSYETGSLVPVTTQAPPLPGLPAAANGLVYVTADDGCLHFLSAETGIPRDPTCLVGGMTMGGPAADASHVYIAKLDGLLVAYGDDSGALKWRTDLQGRIAASPMVDGGLLFIPLATGEIVVYLATGWPTTTGTPVAAPMGTAVPQAARLAAPPPDGASSTQMTAPLVVAGAGDTLHIVTLTNTGQAFALSVYAKARLSITPFTAVPGRPLPPYGGLPSLR